jgi:hypothetical protein
VLVNTSGINGFLGDAPAGRPNTACGTAKLAVKGFSEGLIEDLRTNAPHVRAVLVMPGHVGTHIAAGWVDEPRFDGLCLRTELPSTACRRTWYTPAEQTVKDLATLLVVAAVLVGELVIVATAIVANRAGRFRPPGWASDLRNRNWPLSMAVGLGVALSSGALACAGALAVTDLILHRSGWSQQIGWVLLVAFAPTTAAALLVLGPLEIVWLLGGRPSLEQWRGS